MNASARQIIHFDLDSFFVSVERLKNPALEKAPLIVGGSEGRGVVAACSYETRAFGIHSAMPMKKALQLCPQAIVIKGCHRSYSHYSKLVTDMLRKEVPVLEKASIDEFYADVSGMDRYFGSEKLAAYLKQKVIDELGLPISYALGSNKLITKIAANEVKPDGAIVIPHGSERDYLRPLPIEKMPGIGKKTAQILHQLGVVTLGDLSLVPVKHLTNRLGDYACDLVSRAKGEDDSPVMPVHDQKSISKEETFEQDTTDELLMKNELVIMSEKVAFLLRKKGKLCTCISVKIRYSDFSTLTRQIKIEPTASDDQIINAVKRLFDTAYDKRSAVRLLGVRVSDFLCQNLQGDLFSDLDRKKELYKALDTIRDKFGMGAIGRFLS